MLLNQQGGGGLESSFKIGYVRSSLCPFVSMELEQWFFLSFGGVLETHITFCVTDHNFWKINFYPWDDPNWTENRFFLELLKSFAINFVWIQFIMKVHIFCYIHVHIPYLGKIWFLRYGLTCFHPIRSQNF